MMKTILWIVRLGVLLFVITAVFAAIFILYTRWQLAQQTQVIITGGNPALGPVERFYLQTYLVAKVEELQKSAGTAIEPVQFVVSPGETADSIAANLVNNRLLNDPELFLNYARYYGLDAQLEAGSFTLTGQTTIPELAATLTNAIAQDIELRFLEGWRIEEMANYLAVTTPAQIDAAVFLAIAQRQTPFDLTSYDFLATLPATATLEGFLFPDTYRVPADADAVYLVEAMLQNFGSRLTPAMRQGYGVQGLTVHQAVTLASIVEREAVLAEERPIIASVFYNRLAQAMPLQADPTVQYAIGTSERWWKSPLDVADLSYNSPYNTYQVSSLPPGPIANPSLSSLQAVAEPAETQFIFFVADCTGTPGSHLFSVTYEEHLVNVGRCQ